MPFKCPLCHALEYQALVVPRQRGAPYQTEFFHCLGCSVMFTEPELFTAAPAFQMEQARIAKEDAARDHVPGGLAARASLRSQALRYRFWHAKAKREHGWEPTSEQVLRVRNRYRQ